MGRGHEVTAPWHKRHPGALEQLRQEMAERFQDLTVLLEGETVHLRGGFPVIYEGVELDRFQIEVLIPRDFPKSIPIIKELGGRVPFNVPDWHTYDGGSLCIMVPEEWLMSPEAGSIAAFLRGPVRNFFIAHALAEKGLKRPMGERPHFVVGLWESYGEMVGNKAPAVIQSYLKYLSKEHIKGHWACPCGSQTKLRNCHGVHIAELRKKITPHVATSALRRLHKHTNGQWGAIGK